MKKPVTLVALGDSFTEGFGIPADAAFPAVLERLLRQNGHTVSILNLGVSGDSTGDALQRIRRFFHLQRSPQTLPHAGIIEIGANDGLYGAEIEEVEANLRAILDIFATARIPVLFTGMRALFCEDDSFADAQYCLEFAELFPALAKEYAAKTPVVFYPFFLEGVFGEAWLNLDDGLHPNETGTQKIAEQILPFAETLLEGIYQS